MFLKRFMQKCFLGGDSSLALTAWPWLALVGLGPGSLFAFLMEMMEFRQRARKEHGVPVEESSLRLRRGRDDAGRLADRQAASSPFDHAGAW